MLNLCLHKTAVCLIFPSQPRLCIYSTMVSLHLPNGQDGRSLNLLTSGVWYVVMQHKRSFGSELILVAYPLASNSLWSHHATRPCDVLFCKQQKLKRSPCERSTAGGNIGISLKFCSLWSLYFQESECWAWNYLPWFTIIALSDGRCGVGCSPNLILFLDLEVPLQIKLKSQLPSWGFSAHLVPPLLDKLFCEWQFVAAVP